MLERPGIPAVRSSVERPRAQAWLKKTNPTAICAKSVNPQSFAGPRGVTLVAVLGMLGLLSLLPARFILTVYLMSPAKKATKDQARS
ncbi:hypothetical protein PCA10_23690 [Metapseudomonas resinovorans NBRC 106553]|uniref:Uncharacterized protein n=1 Tax=Metapseudomonas resinovorans NBRC 106553 TaxID=1245471 RepID=S6AUS9_METRE|nr:hypothetical protein PCA10_23690 [Pseudomonas resinovorans NBRC 106553]